jgi:hypothetical protein
MAVSALRHDHFDVLRDREIVKTNCFEMLRNKDQG